MTVKEIFLIKFMQSMGWTVVAAFSDPEHQYWRAYKIESTNEDIVAFDVDVLFNQWSKLSEVMEQVFKIEIKKGV